MKKILNLFLIGFLCSTTFIFVACGDDDVTDPIPFKDEIRLSFNNGEEIILEPTLAKYKINTADTTIDLTAHTENLLINTTNTKASVEIKCPLRLASFTKSTVGAVISYETYSPTPATWGYNPLVDSILITVKSIKWISPGMDGECKVSGTFKGVLNNAVNNQTGTIAGTFMNVSLKEGMSIFK